MNFDNLERLEIEDLMKDEDLSVTEITDKDQIPSKDFEKIKSLFDSKPETATELFEFWESVSGDPVEYYSHTATGSAKWVIDLNGVMYYDYGDTVKMFKVGLK